MVSLEGYLGTYDLNHAVLELAVGCCVGITLRIRLLCGSETSGVSWTGIEDRRSGKPVGFP